MTWINVDCVTTVRRGSQITLFLPEPETRSDGSNYRTELRIHDILKLVQWMRKILSNNGRHLTSIIITNEESPEPFKFIQLYITNKMSQIVYLSRNIYDLQNNGRVMDHVSCIIYTLFTNTLLVNKGNTSLD